MSSQKTNGECLGLWLLGTFGTVLGAAFAVVSPALAVIGAVVAVVAIITTVATPVVPVIATVAATLFFTRSFVIRRGNILPWSFRNRFKKSGSL